MKAAQLAQRLETWGKQLVLSRFHLVQPVQKFDFYGKVVSDPGIKGNPSRLCSYLVTHEQVVCLPVRRITVIRFPARDSVIPEYCLQGATNDK